MKDQQMRNEDIERDEMLHDDDNREGLTTKDMATGVAAKRAPDKSDRRADSQAYEPGITEDTGRSREAAQLMESQQTETPLFDDSETQRFRADWLTIQTQFVDDPRNAVKQADELVAATMKRLLEIFSGERDNLERDWDRGEDVSTEDLRIALQRYRAFFDRLLSV
ncbi:MAG: hypothetical protein M3447_00200 [Acidobacteriota bacterium]|nr:hypothetical protein [Acidobacteriota bacterium]